MTRCPRIWPEVPAPWAEQNCNDCGLKEHGSRLVWGEGCSTAKFVIIVDNPGMREDRRGKAFVCPTRQELQIALDRVRITENDVFFTYILKRRPTRAYQKEYARRRCLRHLRQQFLQMSPAALLLLGNVALQTFTARTDLTVKEERGCLQDYHGFPTVVSYHPLAVRRRPNLRVRGNFAADVKRFAQLIDHYRNGGEISDG